MTPGAAGNPDTGSIDATDVEVFAQALADEPDLRQRSFAARRILATAAALFYERGAAATSVRDITRACGLSPGALYNHFASKDDVLYELVRHGHARLERRIAAALAAAAPEPAGQFGAFVGAYLVGHLAHPELAQMVRREYLHLAEPRRSGIVARRRGLRTQLADLLRAGQRTGDFDLIDGEPGATGVAVMVLDMCSRTSEWYDPSRSDARDALAHRYVLAALRLAGAQP